jgi:hypothetical protein
MLTALPKPVMMIEVRHTGVTSAAPPAARWSTALDGDLAAPSARSLI